jgi:UDP-glucose 4-epimerase
MKFIVTGGAGFIGSHIAKSLIKKGHSVSVIDSLRRGNLDNLKEIKDKIDFQEIDILDYNKMKDVAKNVDGIFHQAALGSVPQSFKEPEEYHKVNAIGTENILKLAKEFGFKVVYASSSSVYGNQEKFPIKEDAEKKPVNPYGKSKLEFHSIFGKIFLSPSSRVNLGSQSISFFASEVSAWLFSISPSLAFS